MRLDFGFEFGVDFFAAVFFFEDVLAIDRLRRRGRGRDGLVSISNPDILNDALACCPVLSLFLFLSLFMSFSCAGGGIEEGSWDTRSSGP